MTSTTNEAAKLSGRAGYSVLKIKILLVALISLPLILLSGICLYALLKRPVLGSVISLIFLPVFSIFGVLLIRKYNKLLNNARDSEIKVANKLSEINKGAYIINDIPFKGFNIDHLAVLKNGIYLLETKSTITDINSTGKSKIIDDWLKQVNFAKYKLLHYLKKELPGIKLEITPLIVLAEHKKTCFKYKNISLVSPDILINFLLSNKGQTIPKNLRKRIFRIVSSKI